MSMTTHVIDALTSLHQAVDKLSLRERVLVLGTAILALVSIWYLFLIQPLVQHATRTGSEIESLQVRIEVSNNSFEDKVLQVVGTGSEYQQKHTQAQQRIDQINESLGDYAAELIDPAEMATVLEDVLKEQSQLRLLHIRNLAPEALSASTDAQTATFYKHGLEIEFEGSYFACLAYLQDIEALPWRFYWQILDLEVLDYPTNRVRLEISTLSLDKEWIGA